jgi:GTP-binding protein
MARVTTGFAAAATTAGGLPNHGLVEVAFAGRSNVGKSTLIGAVLGQPKLVHTSRTPGRTRTLNLFYWSEQMAVVDLPGYGYAKMSKSARLELETMVQSYLSERGSLRGVVLVVDARRVPVADSDRYVADWIRERDRQLLVAINKIDEVPKNRCKQQAQTIEAALGLERGMALLCSGKTGVGREALRGCLLELRA